MVIVYNIQKTRKNGEKDKIDRKPKKEKSSFEKAGKSTAVDNAMPAYDRKNYQTLISRCWTDDN